jgi:hypothetical protein
MPTSDEAPSDHTGSDDEAQRTRPASRARGSVVGAAMLGLGQVIEPEKTKVVIEQASDDPFRDTDLDLDFDRVPPQPNH